MIDKIKNKEMQPDDKFGQPLVRGDLYCTKECDIPGVGSFKPGDAVKVHEHFMLLQDHPFFSNQPPEVK